MITTDPSELTIFHKGRTIYKPFNLVRNLAFVGAFSAILLMPAFAQHPKYVSGGGTWSQGAALHKERSTHAVATVNEKVYAIGGGIDQADASVEEYDPESDIWTEKADLPTGRDFVSCAVVNEKIYVCGGFAGWATFNRLNVYDPATDSWTTKSNMPTSRWGHASCSVNGLVYVIGGAKDWPVSKMYETIEVYNPEEDSWTTKSSIPTPRWGLSCSVVNGKIYVIGGYDEDNRVSLATVEEYDPESNIWTIKSSMPKPRYGIATVAVNNRIYAIGGADVYEPLSAYADVDEYDPLTDSWTAKSPMPVGRIWVDASSVNGRIYVPGGGGIDEYERYPELYIYDPGYQTGIENRINIPDSYHLYQNYPNPFNQTTLVPFDVRKPSYVTLHVYDVLGRQVATLVNQHMNEGHYTVQFNGIDLTSDLYLFRIEMGNYSQTRMMLLSK